jgi:hypothetical protein
MILSTILVLGGYLGIQIWKLRYVFIVIRGALYLIDRKLNKAHRFHEVTLPNEKTTVVDLKEFTDSFGKYSVDFHITTDNTGNILMTMSERQLAELQESLKNLVYERTKQGADHTEILLLMNTHSAIGERVKEIRSTPGRQVKKQK